MKIKTVYFVCFVIEYSKKKKMNQRQSMTACKNKQIPIETYLQYLFRLFSLQCLHIGRQQCFINIGYFYFLPTSIQQSAFVVLEFSRRNSIGSREKKENDKWRIILVWLNFEINVITKCIWILIERRLGNSRTVLIFILQYFLKEFILCMYYCEKRNCLNGNFCAKIECSND